MNTSLTPNACPHGHPTNTPITTGPNKGTTTTWLIDCALTRGHKGKHQAANPTLAW